jgi:DNA-binding CsgD family transcriptional regulator
MNEPPRYATGPPLASWKLRVAIVAHDPIRERGLASLLADLGHVVAVDGEDAEIILADAGAALAEDGEDEIPVVTLGGPVGQQAGALTENASPAQIDAALRAAAAGLTVRDPALAFIGFARLDDPEAPLLTRRELDVLGALGDGLSNKAVARRLGISQHTVKFHLESLFRKLGVPRSTVDWDTSQADDFRTRGGPWTITRTRLKRGQTRRSERQGLARWRLGRGGRMTRQRKTAAVLRLLRGEDLETVSRELGVTAATLTGWHDAFLAGGEAALTSRAATGEELESERLKAKLGAALIERDLLNEKIALLEAGRPFARRRRKP